MKHFLTILLMTALLIYSESARGQLPAKQTFTYAVKDSSALALDFYPAAGMVSGQQAPCVVFVFGGAFVGGHRDDTIYRRYFTALVENGYSVASISYRLGLKGASNLSPLHTAPLKKAIDMAVEDVYDATNWLLLHTDLLGVDPAKIILSGSSSGAITVLESDFYQKNERQIAEVLPPGFRYAGVIAFSGAILCENGKPKYKSAPAPTLLYHGTADRIVPYKKVKLFRKGLYGSSYLAGRFHQKGYVYSIFRVEDMGHEIAVWPMIDQLPAILDFLKYYVMDQRPYENDTKFKDQQQKPLLTMSAKQLFEKLRHN